MKRLSIALIVVGWLTLPAAAARLDPAAINHAQLGSKPPAVDKIDVVTIKAQVLLDRALFSPGEIDGKLGENAQKALRAYAEANNLAASKPLTPEIWAMLSAASEDPVITEYTITESDVKGPFLKKLPAKMEAMKDLKALSYQPASGDRRKISPQRGPACGPQSREEVRPRRPNDFRHQRAQQANQARHRPDRSR